MRLELYDDDNLLIGTIENIDRYLEGIGRADILWHLDMLVEKARDQEENQSREKHND